MDPQRAAIAETVRVEGARILAILIRTVGDVQLAEDAVQEASVAALVSWPVAGVPPEPRAWLTLTARRKAIDVLRREQARRDKERGGLQLIEFSRSDLPPEHVVRDDQLRLIFTCCHPLLSPPTRVALALRTLCGLSPARIAGILMTTEAATARRLTRARQTIAAAGIPYRVPTGDELGERLPAVCAVVLGLYTAGHAPVDGPAAYEADACAEALRLAGLLQELLPDEPMPAAVLALLLLTEARRPARLDDDGTVVTLDRQDRSRWDAAAIARGTALLHDSLRRSCGQADAYQLQAAIAAEHGRSPSYAATDWAEVLRLYDLLVSVAPNAAATLGRAVAAAEAVGPAAGLALLAEVPPSPRRHAVAAELLARQGRHAEAAAELTAALDGPATEPERQHRQRRRETFLQAAVQRDPPAGAARPDSPRWEDARMTQQLTARADVTTDDPARYAKQLVSHLGRRAEFTTEGSTSTAELAGGTGRIVVGDGVLTLLAEAPDADSLARVQHVLGSHLERFGQRNELTVTWSGGGTAG